MSEIVAFPRPKRRIPVLNDQKEQVGFREEDDDLVFEITAVLDWSDFEAMCPQPKPLPRLEAGGKTTTTTDHPDFKIAFAKWASHRANYMMVKSLESTPDLEWDRVKPQDPDTWGEFSKELNEYGLTPSQIVHLQNRIVAVNTIDEEKMEEARLRFLVGRLPANGKSSSHQTVLQNT